MNFGAFGNILSDTRTVDFLFGYTGREFDEETGLQYNRGRYYDPSLGRWISQDPSRFSAGDTNLYRYVYNSPLIFVDPSGLKLASPVQSLASVVGSAAGGLLGGIGASYAGSFMSSTMQQRANPSLSVLLAGNFRASKPATFMSSSEQGVFTATSFKSPSSFSIGNIQGTNISLQTMYGQEPAQRMDSPTMAFTKSMANSAANAAIAAAHAVTDFTFGMYDIATDGTARRAFVEGWQQTRIQPLVDRLSAKAAFRGNTDPGYATLGFYAFEDMIGARAVEAYYGYELTGRQMHGSLWDGGERTQAFLFGISDATNAAAFSLSTASRLTGLSFNTPVPTKQSIFNFIADESGSLRIPGSKGYSATLGTSNTSAYQKTFFEAFPELEGKVVVHHAVPQKALTKYPGVITEAEIHSLENLRGVPKSQNPDVHLSKIAKEWNEFYRAHSKATKEQLLRHATEIDLKYGAQFTPPVGG